MFWKRHRSSLWMEPEALAPKGETDMTDKPKVQDKSSKAQGKFTVDACVCLRFFPLMAEYYSSVSEAQDHVGVGGWVGGQDLRFFHLMLEWQKISRSSTEAQCGWSHGLSYRSMATYDTYEAYHNLNEDGTGASCSQ